MLPAALSQEILVMCCLGRAGEGRPDTREQFSARRKKGGQAGHEGALAAAASVAAAGCWPLLAAEKDGVRTITN